MSEPEGLIIEGARLAVAGARDLWCRARPPSAPAVLALDETRRRLELLIRALCGESIGIYPSDGAPAPTWLARAFGRAPHHLRPAGALAATDGRDIWLPRALDARDGREAALERYRLLALEQAHRVTHGFAGAHPHDSPRIEQDLYRLAEATVVDHVLSQTLPGVVPALRIARMAALAERPPLDGLLPVEREVEVRLRGALAAAPTSRLVAEIYTPRAARAWARREAVRVKAWGPYRGVAPVELWGEPRRPASTAGRRAGNGGEGFPHRVASALLRRRPRQRPARQDEDEAVPGIWMPRFDDPMEGAEDPLGVERPSDQGGGDAAQLGDALAELPEARIVWTPSPPRDVLASDAGPVSTVPHDGASTIGVGGITYPEWDYRAEAYRFPGATVRPADAPAGGSEWVERVLARHATLVREVRRRFDGLRPHRIRSSRQMDGAELDLAACVTAYADRHAGEPVDGRLYIDQRPARRDLAIAVLADVSASTDAWVAGSRRIVDVEKEALIVLLEALDVLGDRHAVLAFSGEGPQAVRVLTIKPFHDRSRAAAYRRVAALEPDGYTRVGAALRHATALLSHERARHRLMLLLSDGKPNDVDEYAGRYGVEDTRQAVVEARLQGLLPFCLTVDRDAPAYLTAIFGPRGYAVLPRPELLPSVLVEMLRALVTR